MRSSLQLILSLQVVSALYQLRDFDGAIMLEYNRECRRQGTEICCKSETKDALGIENLAAVPVESYGTWREENPDGTPRFKSVMYTRCKETRTSIPSDQSFLLDVELKVTCGNENSLTDIYDAVLKTPVVIDGVTYTTSKKGRCVKDPEKRNIKKRLMENSERWKAARRRGEIPLNMDRRMAQRAAAANLAQGTLCGDTSGGADQLQEGFDEWDPAPAITLLTSIEVPSEDTVDRRTAFDWDLNELPKSG